MDQAQHILEYTQQFLTATGFTDEVSVKVDYDADSDVHLVSLSSTSPAILIGYHGDTLTALQTLLGQHLYSQVGQWLNLSVNVNDYRERREAVLHEMADAAVAKVKASGQGYTLPPLPANERRLIHLYLSNHLEVTTESVGEGRQRSVLISPR